MVKEKKERKSPAHIDLEKWMLPEMGNGELVPVIVNDCVVISTRLLPEVHKRLKGLGKVERLYQTAIINAALIQYLDKKEKELGMDFSTLEIPSEVNHRPSQNEIQAALAKS